jgi:hypothetical protein
MRGGFSKLTRALIDRRPHLVFIFQDLRGNNADQEVDTARITSSFVGKVFIKYPALDDMIGIYTAVYSNGREKPCAQV